ncbi:hypothetical protein GCM10022221_68750 [Actinocorallia aurea]
MVGELTTKTIPLAHPLSPEAAANVGAQPVRRYQPGEVVVVPTGQVMRLVQAGLVAGVDPSDGTAITNLFSTAPPKPAKPATPPTAPQK